MKYVSFLFATLLIAGIANATEVKTFELNYSNHNAYYACSYAEGQANKILKTLGGNVLETSCSGGIDHDMFLPLSMEGSFILEPQGGKTVVIRGREACDFNVKLIKEILSVVSVASVKASNTCWDASGNYKFEVTLN